MLPSVSNCIYKDCGKSRRKNLGLHMFTLPIKDEARCRRWIMHAGCGPELLRVPRSELKHLKICENHFEEASFINQLKQRLVHDAVPMPYPDASASESSEIPQFEQIFIVSEPLEECAPASSLYNEAPILLTGAPAASLYDDKPLLLNRSKNTRTY